MEREFLRILENVRDMKRFGEFLDFCVSRLEKGDNTRKIWRMWKKRTD